MKEFWDLLKKMDIKGLLIRPTTNGFLQFFRYLFVGGIATVADWGVMFALTEFLALHHLLSAVFAFFAGLITNFILSKLLVFKASQARSGAALEFLGYGAIGAVGLGITELILYCFTDCLRLYYMASKAIATVVVLVWNYLARKHLLYKS